MRVPLPRVAAPKMVTGDQIAAFALRYKGAGYVFGGNASRPGDWDCSSFASFVLHGVGLGIPGGKWGAPGMPPNSHGPVVESYASWGGAVTVGAPGTRGDLVLFVGQGVDGHMGIVLGPNQMVSALDTASGTLVSPITGYGPPGAPIVYRRVIAAAVGSAVAGGAQIPGVSAPTGIVEALLIIGGMVGAVLLAAALAGTAIAVGGVWVAGRVASG